MKIPLSKLNHEALLNGVVSLAAKVMAEPPVEQAMRVVAGHYRDIQTFRYWQNVLSLVDPDTKVDPDTLPHMLPIGTSSTLGFPLFLLTEMDPYPSIRASGSEIVLSFFDSYWDCFFTFRGTRTELRAIYQLGVGYDGPTLRYFNGNPIGIGQVPDGVVLDIPDSIAYQLDLPAEILLRVL